MKRTLRLNKEALSELASDELRGVAAGSHVPCATHGISCDRCPSIPLNECDIAVVGTITACIVDTLLCPTTPMGGQA